MQFSTQLVAILASASAINAHMIMSSPVPYGKADLNNSPLLADGSDFPCKQRANVYVKTQDNPMALGSTQPLSFIGSATHGGGSCQVSITYDKQPTKNSVWKVIHSIEGGCPIEGVAGNNGDNPDLVNPSVYHFTIPTDLPTGEATLAWTWFNKIGNREMYMNCAPVTLSAGTSKRTVEEDNLVANLTQLVQRDQAVYEALPDMFVANIGNGCGTKDSTDLLFPNPGDSVEKLGTATSSALAAPTGNCAAAKTGSGSGSSGSATTAAAVKPSATTAAANTPAATTPGGVFVTVAPASTKPAVATTLATSAAPVASAPAASSAAAKPSASSSPSTSGVSGVQSGACSNEGAWNCINGTQFQRCASGQWSVAMAVAAGTTCGASGVSANMKIAALPKERRRFRNAHIRRHIQNSS